MTATATPGLVAPPQPRGSGAPTAGLGALVAKQFSFWYGE
jgi:hypothetical protein